MSAFEHPQFIAIQAHCFEDVTDIQRQLILSDWLKDHGCSDAQADEAILYRPLSCWDMWSFGSGSGSGRGRGSGSEVSPYEIKRMEPGKAYLIHGGDWHTFVGRCVKQVGANTYQFSAESSSKIAETNNGDCWFDMAGGDQRLRNAATYKHCKINLIVPLSIACVEWLGKTPQEEGLEV